MSKLLDGIKIVDPTHVLAGPYCAYELGLLGADITRIENPASLTNTNFTDLPEESGLGVKRLATK
ncbi:MAG: crotonobetainyl-CoA:carnitine CoA-transferase CaiB-like acyl-CoA transferase [Candidatus Azotimanducaceae bacterium]|jgi:crotonobetainyl-CoA:carnitine CoA-transferase CaiB-like acyl-CoA transferase